MNKAQFILIIISVLIAVGLITLYIVVPKHMTIDERIHSGELGWCRFNDVNGMTREALCVK